MMRSPFIKVRASLKKTVKKGINKQRKDTAKIKSATTVATAGRSNTGNECE